MNIDFSKGIAYWVDIVNRFLTIINDFWYSMTGSYLFASADAGEEETEEG